MTTTAVNDAIELLKHPLSAKRRSGAKTLRKLQDPAAGQALLQALQKEVQDPRTWETQYQMIMALGACRYVAALPLLMDLADRRFEATMVHVAIGDALVRLAPDDSVWQTITDLVGNADLAYGACQGMAMLRLVPPRDVIEQLLEVASRSPLHETQGPNLCHWIAAAAPGWLEHSSAVRPFLEVCLGSKNEQVRLAAEAALEGKYRKWQPL